MTSYGKRNDELREASGKVAYSDPLTTFFYLLMRNELAAGKVEGLVREAVESSEECLFTNGWLAQYANNLADMIKEAKANHLKSALEQAFEDKEEEAKAKAEEERQEELKKTLALASENLEDAELAELEQKLIAMAGINKTIGDGDDSIAMVTSEEAAAGSKDAVQQLVDAGLMSQEDGDKLKAEVDGVLENAKPEELVGSKKEERPEGVPEAEEIPKEHTEEQKWSPEKAKEVVDTALGAYESAKKLDPEEAVQTPSPEVEEKWKATKEELEKIEEEEETKKEDE